MNVTVGISHWRRPGNVIRIVDALRQECEPVVISTPDSSPLPPPGCRVITVGDAGPYTRYLPDYDGEHVLLLDDDLLPSGNLVAAFAAAAQTHPHDIMGLYGRRIGRGDYNYGEITCGTTFQRVDMLIRAYWMPCDVVPLIREAQAKWVSCKGYQTREDDMLLAWVGRPIYIIPSGASCTNLPDPHAESRRIPNRLMHRVLVWRECCSVFGDVARLAQRR